MYVNMYLTMYAAHHFSIVFVNTSPLTQIYSSLPLYIYNSIFQTSLLLQTDHHILQTITIHFSPVSVHKTIIKKTPLLQTNEQILLQFNSKNRA